MAGSDEHLGITLAIETAIAGGSISLFEGSSLIAGTSGGGSVSRAEDLLLRTDELLRESDVARSDLSLIAVSTGPGSFTGLRIGLATGMGLSMALGIPCSGVPLFDAIARGVASTLAVVVPVGRSDICYRSYENGVAMGDHLVGGIADFVSFVQENLPGTIAHHPDVDVSRIETSRSVFVFTDLGFNLAEYIGRHNAAQEGIGSLEPIYVRNPRFT